MKRQEYKFIFSFMAVMFLLMHTLQAQTKLKLNNEKSTMTIDGTSTLHDWSSTVNELEGIVSFKSDLLSKLENGYQLDEVNFNAIVESIESGRGSTMDNRTYKALKYEEHPKVMFRLKDGAIDEVRGNEFTVEAKGDLTIAGKTQPIEMKVTGKKLDDNTLAFAGTKEIDMTEYDVDPPTAMFGQIEAGKEVTIKFELTFSR